MYTFEQQHKRLVDAVTRSEVSYEIAKLVAARQGRTVPVRHRCFISYHGADIAGVIDFVEKFNEVFLPRVVGVSDGDHFMDPISSEDEEYIKSQIGSKYLSKSTVTILYVGQCTWARKFVDWELSSSLRNDPVNKRKGLLALTPANRSINRLPDRFADNWADDDTRYARYYYYPQSSDHLRNWIEDAYNARESRPSLINNKRALRRINSACS